MRQEHSKPVLADIESLLLTHLHAVLPQSAFGKALHYLHGQWPKLTRYLENGAWPISNNPCENAIRPFVVGRKAWLFCDTVGGANASANLYSLIETCKANGVTEVTEVKIGYDGIVFALDKSAPDFAFEPADVYKALAAEIVVDGKVVANPNTSWKQVNDKFADLEIKAFIPGEKHGTREVFEEKLLIAGCEATGSLEAMIKAGISEDDAESKCMAVRKDGKAVDIDGDYSETLARIDADKKAVGVFGLSFYENNADKLKVATVGGVLPSVDTVATGEYPVSRPLFFYVKKAHLESVPGLKEYVEFFTSDQMIGPDSPLAEYGLIPAPDAEREEIRAAVSSWKNM